MSLSDLNKKIRGLLQLGHTICSKNKLYGYRPQVCQIRKNEKIGLCPYWVYVRNKDIYWVYIRKFQLVNIRTFIGSMSETISDIGFVLLSEQLISLMLDILLRINEKKVM